MKKLVIVLMLLTMGLGAVCVIQQRALQSRRAEVKALQAERDEQATLIQTLEDEQEHNADQRHDLLQRAEELAGRLQALQAAAATNRLAVAPPPTQAVPASAPATGPAPEPGGFGKFLSKMMQDPDTRNFIRQQQRTMIDQLYAPLVKQMGLTPEEANQFKDLLSDQMMKGADKASALLGETSTANRAEVTKAIAADQKAFDEEVKAYLGEERYAQYKDYQETAGERIQLNAFKQQNGADNFLSEAQTEELLSIMRQEKKNVASTTGQSLAGLNGMGQNQMDFASLNEEQIDKLLQSQETVNQRVYQRAQTFLSPDQMATLNKFQANQIQMMRMGMTMARKFLAPDQGGESAGP